MKKKRLLTLIGSICLILVLVALLLPACAKEEAPVTPAPVAPKPAPEQIVWKMVMFLPSVNPAVKLAESYLPKFEEATHGRLKVKVYHSSTLVDAPGTPDALQRGVCDIGCTYHGALAATFPVHGATNVIMVWRDMKGFHDAQDHLIDLYEEDFREHGLDNVGVLRSVSCSEMVFGTTKKEIKVPADSKGLKIACWGASYKRVFDVIGVKGVVLPGGEFYEAMEKGVVDGFVGTHANFVEWKFGEVCNYAIRGVPGFQGNNLWLYSKKSLNNLPEDIRPIVRILMDDLAMRHRLQNYEYRVSYWPVLIPKMVKVYTPTAEDIKLWEEAAKPAENLYLESAGARGQEALEIIKKYNAR